MCGSSQAPDQETGEAKTQEATAQNYTWAEVKKHHTPSDAWIVYMNKVYNVSDWFDHPGGAVVFTHAGDDMTDIFAAFHPPGATAMLKDFYIGNLVVESVEHKDDQQHKFERGYRELRAQLVKMGLFKSSKLFYAYKCVSTLMLACLAAAMVYYSDRVEVHIASALLLGLCFQQSGWLAHDYCHHQVFRNRFYNDLFGLFWGNVVQGYSVQWWKNKHNGHHAVPNLHNTSAQSQDGDPDIDTMPLLAWSLKQAQSYRELHSGMDTPLVRFMVKYQAYFYFPILFLARLSWMNESVKMAFGLGAASENAKMERERQGLKYPLMEQLGILLHYSWMFAVSCGFGRFSPGYSAAYFLLATCSCGLFLAMVFGLGHNGMATYDAEARPDFWKLQVTTTRNIIAGHGIPQGFVNWFCGGLQYQVDHHLFPQLPRHNLKKAHGLVETFCKEWGVKYHEADMVDGTIEVLKHLDSVADKFCLDFVLDGPTM